MKQIVLTSRNLSFIFDEKEDKLSPSIECIIVLGEPEYEMNFDGAQKKFNAETIRFVASPSSIREVSKQFMEWADDAEKQAEKIDKAKCD